MKKLSILLTLGACSSGNIPNVEIPSHNKPSNGAKRYKAKNNWNIRGKDDIPSGVGSVSDSGGVLIWNLQGTILDGSNQSGDGSQNEDQEPLFRARVPLIVKNGFVQKNKNAMIFYAKDSGIERITFTDIGEDAVATSKGAYNFKVINCEFINDRNGDKSVQLNEAKDALVSGNLIFSGRTCIRIGDSGISSSNDVAAVKGNRFVGCETGINASKITVSESGNRFESVPTPTKTANGAVIK